jgi:hypothetical protein
MWQAWESARLPTWEETDAMILPIPVSRYLVPELPVGLGALPPGYTLLDQAITAGLPHRMTLDAGLTVTLSLPTGLAREWLHADGYATIAESGAENATDDADAPRPARRPAPRLIVRGANGALVGVVPLSAGLVRGVGDSGGAGGMRVTIMVLAYDLRAGSARGPGDWGSRITIGWRHSDKGTNSFEPPPLNPSVIPRLPQQRESFVGNFDAFMEADDGRSIDRHLQAREKWRNQRQSSRKRRTE